VSTITLGRLTHYQLLGVMPRASVSEIRAAYLSLARRFHPDLEGGSTERMRQLNDAWSVLGDERRRRAYDLAIGAVRIGDDPVVETDDLADLWDDRPVRPPVTRHGSLVVAPVALFGASVAVGIFGMMMVSSFLLGAAVALFLLACLLMVAMPLVEMARSR
jgi:hypothetical protein